MASISPTRKVTANMGMEMPSWYVFEHSIKTTLHILGRFDIYSFGFDVEEDSKGMLQTVQQLNALIESEVEIGLDPSRIILGGFSQGAAMSLLTGLTCKHKLGGVVVLSGWLPLRKNFVSVSTARRQ